MHFLAHIYAQRQQLTPEFMFGLIMPDLVPGFTKTFNRAIAKAALPENGLAAEIHKGIHAHFADDKLFHALKLFENFCAELTQTLTDKGLNRSELRTSVIAHLLTEMLFDRWLAAQHAHLPFEFYTLLEQLNEEAVHLYSGKKNLMEEKRISLEKRDWFLNFRFLHQLQNSEQMVQGVSRIYGRSTGTVITKNNQFRIIEAVNDFYAKPRLWQLLLIR